MNDNASSSSMIDAAESNLGVLREGHTTELRIRQGPLLVQF